MITKQEHGSWKIIPCASLRTGQRLKSQPPPVVRSSPSESHFNRLVPTENAKSSWTLEVHTSRHAALKEAHGVQRLNFDSSIPGLSALTYVYPSIPSTPTPEIIAINLIKLLAHDYLA